MASETTLWLMTKTEYAKHRGVSKPYITKLAKNGVLVMRGGKIDVHATDTVLDDKPVDDVDPPPTQASPAAPPSRPAAESMGQENEPVALDRFSPILHLVQSIRDEAHRFAVTFHRTRRNAQRLTSELDQIRGVGQKTVQKLLKHFGSSELVRAATEEELSGVVGRAAARKVREFYMTPAE